MILLRNWIHINFINANGGLSLLHPNYGRNVNELSSHPFSPAFTAKTKKNSLDSKNSL